MPLTGHSVGTYLEMSSYVACQETLGHSHLSLLSHCGLILAQNVESGVNELISTLKKKSASRE